LRNALSGILFFAKSSLCSRVRERVCCSVMQCDAVCCSVLQCVAVCCSVWQCVAVCCSVLQCVAVCYNEFSFDCTRYSYLTVYWRFFKKKVLVNFLT